MSEELFQVQGQVMKVSTMSHRSLRLVVDSQEGLSDEQMARLASLHEKTGHFCFLPETRQIDTLDVVGLPPMQYEKDEKSPSQRMRAVLFIRWEQLNKPTATFEEYYRQWYERAINAVKEKLT